MRVSSGQQQEAVESFDVSLIPKQCLFCRRRRSSGQSKTSRKSAAEDAEVIAKSMKLIQEEKEEEGSVSIFFIFLLSNRNISCWLVFQFILSLKGLSEVRGDVKLQPPRASLCYCYCYWRLRQLYLNVINHNA